jgi:hypothetical protein
VTEADNLDLLTNKLKQMIPELLVANHQMAIENNKNIAFELITHRQKLIQAS